MKENPKIRKYLDKNGIYSPIQSEIVRQAYKDSRVTKETSTSKLINIIFNNNVRKII